MNKETLYELKHKRHEALDAAKAALGKKDMDGYKDKMAEVEGYNTEIEAAEKVLAEEGRFDDGDEAMKGLAAAQKQKQEEAQRQKGVDEIRGSNEYTRAFAKALRTHAMVKTSGGVADFAPLYKALQESGGAPEGADGGFLVPIDFDNTIIRLAKDYLDLSDYFNVETVRTLTGWRVIEAGTPKALPSVEEMATITKADQPKFAKIEYKVKKYGERLVISDELLDDNAANLLAYVAGWFAPKYILTKNSLLLPMLTGLETAVELAEGEEDKTLRGALITKLNTAHSRRALLLTNQSGYAAMDSWEDKNGRPLLVPNPADPQVMRYRGRQVVYGDDTEIAQEEETKTPIYVGNFKALGTLFVRKGFEMATTNIGGDAWATDSTELRVLCRLDAQAVDKTAAFKATIGASEAV